MNRHADPQERAATVSALPMQPAARVPDLVGGTASSLWDLWEYRQLLGLLVRRELKIRYKDSALGFVWSLLRPLALLLVYYLAIGKFLGAERQITDFAVYVFTGLTVWQLFAEAVSSGTGSIVANAGLVKKVYLPREVFPLSVVGSALFNTLIQLGLLCLATLVLGRFPTGSGWLYLVPSLLLVVVYGTALGLLLSAWNVYLRDIQYLVEIGLLIGFWLTPVVYSYKLVSNEIGPAMSELYMLNPVSTAVIGLQQTFWVAGAAEPVPAGLPLRMAVMLLVGLVLLWVAQRVFARLEGNFAQEL
jgi:ABC-2 type transport system permease protein